ncbi:hypothetical protein [uncultured Amphritea sp.]|uniref:hypothetical protein n=1 Tax=uncultured Amphritea sp. TaxID=981605 RepID=UPI0026319E63|nr:hypothetical protein [uncultured Amphritea sp.]
MVTLHRHREINVQDQPPVVNVVDRTDRPETCQALSNKGLGDNAELFISASMYYQELIMFNKTLMMTVMASSLLFTHNFVLAADQDQTRLQDPDKTMDMMQDNDRVRDTDQLKDNDQTRDMVYGSHLMTDEERSQYRTQMQAAKTDEERAQIRTEHHQRMQVRAEERGVTLPDNMPAKRSGMGTGAGMGTGSGMGYGNGMGNGSGAGNGGSGSGGGK